jgi:single-stranded-DNA-specific exonuclease
VAFKLLHGILQKLSKDEQANNAILMKYIDFASLGTVADCMPLIGENRTITALGLKQMKKSESSALRKYIENLDKETDGDADVIGFQIGPRINAAGRMDTPLKALHWLLATEDRVDDWLLEVENLNIKRQEEVKKYTEDALMNVDASLPILFYTHDHIEHGLIGLVAGRLTEAYGKPAIVLCKQHESKSDEIPKREYEKELASISQSGNSSFLVASCRSPEWCNLIELLDICKPYFSRYG